VAPLPSARVVQEHVRPHAHVGVAALVGHGVTLPPAQPAANDIHGVAKGDDREALQYVAVGNARERAHSAPCVVAWLIALEAVGVQG
jgi:hypothetical protein